MKRILFALGVAVLLLNTMIVPTAAHADGGAGGGSNCGSGICKP